MADVTQLKTLVDAYGVAVRAGAITPQSEDEVYFRNLIGLPCMSKQNALAWQEANGIKQPITLKTVLENQDQDAAKQEETNDETE